MSVEIIELQVCQNNNLSITALDKDKGVHSYGSYIDTISFELDILGEPAHFRVNITESHVRLADIVPLARKVSAKITELVIEKTQRSGQSVPCCRDCSACCSFLVPLSVPEAFRLREDILVMPERLHRSILQSCFSVAGDILKQKPPESFMDQSTSEELINPVELDMLANWYSNFKQICPFLHKDACIIYEQRPLACREYFIKGSAIVCRGGDEPAEVIKMPVRIVEALGRLTSALEGRSVEAVIMPLTLVWCKENLERDKQTWPAVMMVQRFVNIVKVMLETQKKAQLLSDWPR